MLPWWGSGGGRLSLSSYSRLATNSCSLVVKYELRLGGMWDPRFFLSSAFFQLIPSMSSERSCVC